ncbi:hypothetical protein EDD17DRAFT_1514483 [Pisolithus thermaeus]|nr:hypothetical protein EV401DRAFT_1891556 [Pisolithus croceorrhizus]KAI6147615.1 hypothetical protein EDD17DRAFT_1514483 [Pisolithus thermaeus]
MIQLASAVHEAPISKFNGILSTFQLVSYPHDIILIPVNTNSDMEENHISVIPDLTLVISSMKGNKTQCIPLILKCALFQPHREVFEKVSLLTAACPNVIMVIIILISKSPHYRSLSQDSLAWRMFKEHHDPLDLEHFMSLCNENSAHLGSEEQFTSPVVAAVCKIWLDPDVEVEWSDWSVDVELPENKNIDHFDMLPNKGLDMIWQDIIQYFQKIAAHHNLHADCSGLEKSIYLPPSWDHFHIALLNVRELTAHAHYVCWYKDAFRGKKHGTAECDVS